MIKDQMFLFPEHDYFQQKEKNIDFVYLDEIKNSLFTNKKYSDLPKKRYILWKTGAINPYMPDLGPVFPYIYDTLKEKIKTIRIKSDNQYPRMHLKYFLKNKIMEIKPLVHSLVCNAFVKNPLPEKFNLVHHVNNNPLDYRPSNLQHVNQSINITDTKKTKFGTVHDDYMMTNNIRTKKT
tara:strand:- start:12 stop:551 length:540 start_codon:yes stop_codon:yes gene_type:complete